MTLDDINKMSNEALLDAYSLMVRVNHYDPMETPNEYKELRAAGVSEDILWRMIIERMAGYQ